MGFENPPQDPEQQEKERHTLEVKGGHTITVEEDLDGTFYIVGNSVTAEGNPNEEATGLAFSDWDDEVLNFDSGADLGPELSQSLKWNDVEINPTYIEAPSLERAQEALRHVGIGSYIPGDI